MATINVKDAAGATVALEKPLTPGATTASASRPVTLATDDALVTAVGAKTDAKNTATDTTAVSLISVAKQVSASVQTVATNSGSALPAGTNVVGKVGIDQTSVGTTNAVSLSQIGTTTVAAGSGVNGNGVQRVTLPTDQTWPTGMAPKGFSATFTTLTRPANTTAYTALDSISDNATAGSVTALSATVSDTNDDPITITEILVKTTDTGLAGKRIRAYLFNSDPTASTGVGAGDNAAYSQKQAGYIGSCSGILETGFSDGAVGRLVPTFADNAAASTGNAAAGGFIVTKPNSGAKTLYIQYQAIDGFTPSANSTTIIGTARGFQGRAS